MIESLNARSRVKKLTAVVLFSAIILVFVFWGMSNHGQGGSAGSAAIVNKAIISHADLQMEAQRLENIYNQFMGGASATALRQRVYQEALQTLIYRELISQTARKAGILSTDVEVRDFITQDIPFLQKEGRFQRDYYEQFLASNRWSPSEFEDKIRADRKNVRARRLFELSMTPTSQEVEKANQLRSEKLNVSYVKFNAENLIEAWPVSDKEIASKLQDAAFADRVDQYYKTFKSQYTQAEEVKAQHILVKVDPKDPKSAEKALKQAEELRARADKEDFGKLAAQYSDDTGSKTKNGDLGYFGRGRMVPEFEEIAFTMNAGEVSKPVKTQFGYHIIKVNDKKEAREIPLAEVREKIAKHLIAKDEVDKMMPELEKWIADGSQDKVNSWLKEHGFQWQETGLFSLDQDAVPKLGQSPTVNQAAFELSNAKPWLGRLIKEGSERYILKLKEVKAEPVKSSNSELAQEILKERSFDAFNGWVEQARADSRIEANPQALTPN